SELVPGLPPALDALVMKGLDREADSRFASAREMAEALERILPPAAPREIGAWVHRMAGEALEWRMDLVRQIESETSSSIPPFLPVDSPAGAYEAASAVNSVFASDAKRLRGTSLTAAEGKLRSERPTVAELPSSVDEPESAPELPQGRSWIGVAAATLAAVLVLGAAALLAVRWVQVREEAATLAPSPSSEAASTPPEAEPAIVIGADRDPARERDAPRVTPASHAADCD